MSKLTGPFLFAVSGILVATGILGAVVKRQDYWRELRQHNCVNLTHEQWQDLHEAKSLDDAAWMLGQWHDHAAQEQAMLANSPLNTDESRAEHIREHEAFQAAYQWYDNYWNKK